MVLLSFFLYSSRIKKIESLRPASSPIYISERLSKTLMLFIQKAKYLQEIPIPYLNVYYTRTISFEKDISSP
jgi:hypothetical protein